jgi:hypothetical protein
MKPMLTVLVLAACAPQAPPAAESCFHGALCCPAGYVAQGVTRDGKELACSESGAELQDCFVDRATYRSGLQACPDGTAVRGINREAHTLVCCFDRRRGYTATRDDETVELDADSCGSGRVLTGVDPDGALLCRSLDPAAPPAPQVAAPQPLIGEVSGSDAPRSFPGAAQHQLWKRINRNWLSRVFDIPVHTWLQLNAGVDPPAVGFTAGPITFACHAPQDGSHPCRPVPECGPAACRVPQQHVTYESPVDGRTIAADLFFPPANLAQPVPLERPVVLVTHGHAIDGFTGKQATGSEPDSKYRAAARELAAVDQVIAIAPDARTFGESALRWKSVVEKHAEVADENPYGTLPPAYALENIYNLGIALRATWRGYRADPTRVFAAGLSLGGWQAIWAGALDPRITGVIAGGSFLQVWQTNEACDSHLFFCSSPHGASDRCQVVPGLSGDSMGDYSKRVLFDVADMAALAAPARYLVTWGTRDENFGEKYQVEATRGAQAVYAALGIPDRFREVRFSGAHEWNSAAADAFVGE